jgi:hypothetical protein
LACRTTADTLVKDQTDPAQCLIDTVDWSSEQLRHGSDGSPFIVTKPKQLPMPFWKLRDTFLQKLDPRLQFVPMFDGPCSYCVHKGITKDHFIPRCTLPVLLDLEPDNLTRPCEKIRAWFKLVESFPQDQTALLGDVLCIRPPGYERLHIAAEPHLMIRVQLHEL